MKKRITLFLTTVIVLVIFSLTCSAAGTISYVAAQSWPAASTLITETMSSATTVIYPALADPTVADEEPPLLVEEKASDETVSSEDPEAEYYRAVFDVCIFSAHQAGAAPETAVAGCQDFVRRAIAGNWFGEPSRGWEWPLRYQLPGSEA
jgi:hypothetical protein